MNLLVLTRYGSLGASSRLRFNQFFHFLKTDGIAIECHSLIGDIALTERYSKGGYNYFDIAFMYTQRVRKLLNRKRYDLIWIEKESLPWIPYWIEKLLLGNSCYVLDFDDAVFHNYDQSPNQWVRHFLGQRVDNLMRNASAVICGNQYLAARARQAGTHCVEILPTVVDLTRYTLSQPKGALSNRPKRLVWIGSPTTSTYLDILAPALKILAHKVNFSLRVIGASFDISGVNIECIPWTEESEADLIAECDIGLMPLLDSAWEQGKCGYKLIQYMACGLPVIASPVGVNTQIVVNGKSGFLASDTDSWVRALTLLLMDSQRCQEMGRMGRLIVEREYCVEVTAPKLISYLKNALL